MKATQINLCRLFRFSAVCSGGCLSLQLFLSENAFGFKIVYIFALDNGVTIACGGG